MISPSFQGLNRLFVLSIENEDDKIGRTGYYLPKVEVKDYNINIDGKNSADQPISDDFKTYEIIRKIAAGHGDDYITSCLLDCFYTKQKYKLIPIDLSKQQVLDADSRAIQGAFMFFTFEEEKETVSYFSQGTARVL